MKRYTIIRKSKVWTVAITTSLIPLLFTGCSDFLEVEPRNEIVLDQFWNEKSDIDNIVAGCYSALQSEACIKRMIVWGEARSENISPGLNTDKDGSLLNLLNENITSKNGYTTWVDFYRVINRCNTVIKYAPEVAKKDQGYTESEMRATIAEVTALRSLSYFYLIRTFRNVPYSTVAFTDDDQEMMFPVTTFENILDSLVNDLERVKDDAVRRYPSTDPLYQTGRITQEAIHAMLCEMYLWKQDYDKCIQYADLVIDSKKKIKEEIQQSRNSSSGSSDDNDDSRTNGYPLVRDAYGSSFGNSYTQLFGNDLWSSNNPNMQEVIFQLIFDDSPSQTSMIDNRALNDFYGYGVGNAIISGFLRPSDFVIEDIDKTSNRNIFDDKNKKVDARIYNNCIFGSKIINKYLTRSITINTSTSTPQIIYNRPWSEKQSGANWIIYRLSDIMLMKAEAITQKLQEGSEDEIIKYNQPLIAQAFSLVNAVNKRSVCQSNLVDTLVASDYTTKSQMETLVLKERHRELMFEGKRWYDLVRVSRRDQNTNVLRQAALQKVTSGAGLIGNKLTKMDAMYMPYNYNELLVNTYLVQNPAYEGAENKSYE